MDFAFHKSIAENLLRKTEQEINEIEASDLVYEMKVAQRYRVMQLAFDELIEESKSYKDILKTIKISYDDYLKFLEDNNYSSIALSSKLKNMAAKQTTLTNLRKRGDQLEENLMRLREQNEMLKDELLSLDFESTVSKDGENSFIASKQIFTSRKPAKQQKYVKVESPGTKPLFDEMDISECLDEEKLRETLKALTSQFEIVKQNRDEKFISKDVHDASWNDYSKKAEQKTLLENTYFDLQKELYLVSVANDAARSYNEAEVKGKTIAAHVYDTLVEAFKHSLQFSDQLDERSRDQMLGDSEAASIITHVEHFHILFDEKRYEQAAFHASKSPKGVLRSIETFRKFKEAQDSNPGDPIMYHYAMALMSTTLHDGIPSKILNDEMSVEFVRAMVKAGEQKLVYQWFQNGLISTSKQVADLLACDKHNQIHGTVVAETIYMRLGLYHDAIRCMAFRGDIPAAISFAQDTACYERDDYIDLLLSVPSVKLARALSVQKYPGTNKVLLPCGQIALLLLKDINIDIVGEFLKGLDLTPPVVARQTNSDEELADINSLTVEPNCIFSDQQTSSEDWFHIVKHLEHTVYENLGVEIVTALSLNDALEAAMKQVSSA